MKTLQQDIGNSREARLYQGQALRVCALRPALTEPSLPTPPEGGNGDGAAGAHPLTSGGAQVLGLIFKELPTNSADEAFFNSCWQMIISCSVKKRGGPGKLDKPLSGKSATTTTQ